MAISAATMTVTLTESVTLNGAVRGNTNTLTLSDIHEVSERTVNVPTSEKTIINFGTGINAGMFIEGDVKYITITNKDATNHIGLIFQNEDNDEFSVKVDKGQSFIYNGDIAGGVVDTMDAVDNAGLTPNTFADLVSVTAIADTAACDVEFIVACV